MGFYPGLEIIAKLATVLEVHLAELLRLPGRRGSRRPTSKGSALSNPAAETVFDREPWEPKVLELKTGGSSAYCGAVAEQVKPVAMFRSPKAAVRILKGVEHNDR